MLSTRSGLLVNQGKYTADNWLSDREASGSAEENRSSVSLFVCLSMTITQERVEVQRCVLKPDSLSEARLLFKFSSLAQFLKVFVM